MPEKPEVITVAKTLKSKIIGKRIQEVEVHWDNIIATPSVKEFKNQLVGKTIKDIKTRGKFIVINMEEYSLLIHLRMEGKFFFRKREDEKNKHEHVIIRFSNDDEMRYHDVRKFGKMYFLKTSELEKVKPLADLGYEYDDPNLTKTFLHTRLENRKLPIKTVLLDQSIITGIGNIYDDEILFLSRISPYRKAYTISLKECQSIIDNTKIVLEKAIKLGGTTIRSYTSSEGVHGLFQHELLVHGKKDELCPNCKKTILKVKIGGRGTYYCQNCQK